MAEAITYQCPNCQGVLSFNATTGQLECAFCDSVFAPQAIEALYAQRQAEADAQSAAAANASAGAAAAGVDAAGGAEAAAPDGARGETAGSETTGAANSGAAAVSDPIARYLEHARWENLAEEDLRALNCSSCGARLMVDKTTAVTNCPYCGNATVIPGQLSDVLKPDFVIPFKLDRDAAIQALSGYYKGKRLLPNSFTANNHIEDIQGVYVPFWLYSGHARATLDTNARNTRIWTDTKNTYTATDHYHVHREGTMEFHHVPVDGSLRMPDGHMDSIEPFDYRELTPFSLGYLPGFITDRFDQDVETCRGRAQHRAETTCGDVLHESIVGFSEVDHATAAIDLQLDEIAYALLPVWMLHTKWNDQDYLFAMNGQTGKMVGDLPIDRGKCVKLFATAFLITAVVLTLLLIIVGIWA